MLSSALRLLRRLLLLASEFGILVLGFVLSLVGANSVDRSNNGLAPAVFISGLVLTALAFWATRRRTRLWKIEYDAVAWTLAQAQRRLHPRRARYKRIAFRGLICVPSVIALVVAAFFPVATHIVHPSSHYLRHYRIPIPWTSTVFAPLGPPAPSSYVLAIAAGDSWGRFGITPFWVFIRQPWLSSEMVFGSIDPNAITFEFNQQSREREHSHAVQPLRRDFRLGSVAFTCWQHRSYDVHFAAWTGPSWWNITCETPPDARRQNLYAWFFGSADDIPAFYATIERVKPLE